MDLNVKKDFWSYKLSMQSKTQKNQITHMCIESHDYFLPYNVLLVYATYVQVFPTCS